MKKIISLFLVLITVILGFCACSQSGEFENDDYSKAQMEIIENFSISLENRRIVGFKGENDHLVYIIVEYDEKVQKISETTYYFCFNESVYNAMVDNFKDEPEFNGIKDKIYFTFKSDKASTGKYESDVEKLKTEFTVV